MNNCDCNPCGQGIVPATVCCKKKEKEPPIKLATVNYPAQYGTDADGQPHAPQYGKFTNTIVTYAANNARYIYDGQGEYTKIISDDQFDALEQKLTALLNEETEARQSDVENLQTNINQLANKEAEDVENLQANINVEVNARLALAEGLAEETAAREEADEALSTRIDEVINSPDVRYIVESYADLEAIDKATVGDQDYARVLVDETHDGQSTFYQFNKAGNDWTYVGAAGAYYTKTEVDTMIDNLSTEIGSLGVGGKVGAIVDNYADTASLAGLQNGQVVLVLQDETHDYLLSAYEVKLEDIDETKQQTWTQYVPWVSYSTEDNGWDSNDWGTKNNGQKVFTATANDYMGYNSMSDSSNSGYSVPLWFSISNMLQQSGYTVGIRRSAGTPGEYPARMIRYKGWSTLVEDKPITPDFNYIYMPPGSVSNDGIGIAVFRQWGAVEAGEAFEIVLYEGKVGMLDLAYVGSVKSDADSLAGIVTSYGDINDLKPAVAGQYGIVIEDETHNNQLSAYQYLGAPEVDPNFFSTPTTTATNEGAFYNTISNPLITVTRPSKTELRAETTSLMGGSADFMNLNVLDSGDYEAVLEKGVTFFVKYDSANMTDTSSRIQAMGSNNQLYYQPITANGIYVYVSGTAFKLGRGNVRVLGSGSGSLPAGSAWIAKTYLGQYTGGELPEEWQYVGSTASAGGTGGAPLLIVDSFAELEEHSAEALGIGTSAIVLADESHDDKTSFYEVTEQQTGGEADQTDNMLVGNTNTFYSDPTDTYWDWESNPEKAILAFVPKTNPAGASGITLTLARSDLVPGFSPSTKRYSIQIQALTADTPASIMLKNSPVGSYIQTVPTDGTNVNIPATFTSEIDLTINNTTFPNGAAFNIRLYEGLDHAQPGTVGGETILAWTYKGSAQAGGSGSSVELYDSFSTATDGANTANFINNKLNGNFLMLGQGASGSTSATVLGKNATGSGSYDTALGYDAYASSAYSTALGYSSYASGQDAIAVGDASAQGLYAIAIGKSASVSGSSCIAIGNSAHFYNSNIKNSVALGSASMSHRDFEVSIGSGNTTNGTRYLANVTAGVQDTDAVNMSQLNALIARVEALEANAS